MAANPKPIQTHNPHMGLSSFPSASEGVLPVIVVNTILSVSLLKSLIRSAVETVAGRSEEERGSSELSGGRRRRISVTQFRALRGCKPHVGEGSFPAAGGGGPAAECCVCLSRFKEEDEVGELSCRHVFHKGCLERWFGSERSTCPLCRSSH